jgi:hypothetical protein
MADEKETPLLAQDDDAAEEVEVDVNVDDDKALSVLKQRCENAALEVREREYEDGQIFRSVLFPSGREKRQVPASGERAESLLEIEFEKFVFLPNLEAICSYREQYIEAEIRGYPTPLFLARQIEAKLEKDPESEGLALVDANDPQAPKVVLGFRSRELEVLTGGRAMGRGLSIKILGGGFAGQEEAQGLLLRIANSVGFKMELSHGSGFSLIADRMRRFIPRRRRMTPVEDMAYPTHEYENAPISLYWYAREARGLPLLRFLALYQCVEFFFPTYAESEAKRRVSLILKDPAFRLDRDSDLARVLTAVRLGRSGFGDEKTQLKSTLDGCVDPTELREFIESDEALAEHVSNKSSKSKFHKVPVANKELDLRGDVATRIYDIRCKIVHTKDEQAPHGRGMILPGTDEANALEYDNSLIEFIAQRVLIGSSVPIRFLS